MILKIISFLVVTSISFIIIYTILAGIISVYFSLACKRKFLDTFLFFFDEKISEFILKICLPIYVLFISLTVFHYIKDIF